MTMQVSVVIPVRNDAVGLPAAVASSLRQTSTSVSEVLVCVGPSDDGTETVAAQLAAQYSQVRVVDNPDGGIADALNRGLAAASGAVLVRVDARCTLPADYVANALETMLETGAANVGAMQLPVGDTMVQRGIAAAMRDALGSGGASYRVPLTGRKPSKPEPADTAFLGVYRVDALERIGGWDRSFERNEDAELNRRLLDARPAGADAPIWLDPRLVVRYQPRATIAGLARQYFDYGWWRRRMLARHGGASARQMGPPVLVLGLGAGALLAVAVSPGFGAIPLGYLAGVTVRSLRVGTRAPERLTPAESAVMAIAQITMHLAWGSGFIASFLRGPLTLESFASNSELGDTAT